MTSSYLYETNAIVVIKVGKLDAPQPCAYCDTPATAGFTTFDGPSNPGGRCTAVCTDCAERDREIQILEQVQQVYEGAIDSANIIKHMPGLPGECRKCGKPARNYVISASANGSAHDVFHLCDGCLIRDSPATDLAFDAKSVSYVRRVS